MRLGKHNNYSLMAIKSNNPILQTYPHLSMHIFAMEIKDDSVIYILTMEIQDDNKQKQAHAHNKLYT